MTRGMAMIKPQRPQRGDVVITKAVDGFWTHRPLFLGDSHTASKFDTLEVAVVSGGLIAYMEHVDLWLVDNCIQCRVLANCRKEPVSKDAWVAHADEVFAV